MKTGTEWLDTKIQQGVERIEDSGGPDTSFYVPFWRQWQLRHDSTEALSGVIAATQEIGYDLRGGSDLAEASIVFIEPRGVKAETV